MTLFTSLKRILSPRTPSTTAREFQIPYDLTPSEWANLKTLTSHAGWPTFLKVLDATVKLKGEMILQSSKDEAIHFLRGTVHGIRESGTVIEREIANEKRHSEEKNRLENARKPGNARNAVLYGSPAWRDHSRD